jgi:phage-related protein
MNIRYSKNWDIEYYESSSGRRPVIKYINKLGANDRAKIDYHFALLSEFGPNLGKPHAGPIKGYKPLWELRPKPYRILYFLHKGRRFFMLHVIKKKRWKIPKKDIDVAMNRMKIVMDTEK